MNSPLKPPPGPGHKLHGEVLEMTPERRKRLAEASDKLIDFLRANTEGPVEAIALMQLAIDGLAEMMGVEYAGIHTIPKSNPEGSDAN